MSWPASVVNGISFGIGGTPAMVDIEDGSSASFAMDRRNTWISSLFAFFAVVDNVRRRKYIEGGYRAENIGTGRIDLEVERWLST